jgi:uncharacterized protein YbjT (DUF2867 family)
MRIVVVGGTGLIGTKVVAKLRAFGHAVVVGSRSTGIDIYTGEGLSKALNQTDVVIDLSNAPSWEDKAVLDFFQTAGKNLLSAEIKAGVRHHLALSIVGVDAMQNVGYMRGKKAQEDAIRQASVPYCIIRSTQFFEFIKGIADQATEGNIVHISDVLFQPIAAEDVATFVVEQALAAPINGVMEIAGPGRFTMPQMVTRFLEATGDPRKVVPNDHATYYGGEIDKTSLVPAGKARLGTIDFEKWLAS